MSEDQTEAEGVEIEGVDEEMVRNRTTEEYVKNDPLVDLLTPGAKVRIVLSLVRLRGGKLNPSGICDRAAINYDTWYKYRDDLIETYGVIEEMDNTGDSPLYRVDMDHPIIQRLDEIRDLAAAERNRATVSDRQ